SCRARRCNPVPAFHRRHEFAKKKILVPLLAVVRINVKTRSRRGRHYQKFAQLMLLPQIFDQIPAPRMQKHLLVIAEPVKKIEHRIALRLLDVVTRRKQNAVRNGTREKLASYALALHATGSLCSGTRRSANQQSQ